MNLKGKIAVVTGAGGGIGLVLVKRLEEEGVTCILVEKEKRFLDELLSFLQGDRTLFECDLSIPKEVEKLGRQIASNYQKVDLLYNVAGIGIYKKIEDLSLGEWQDSLAINLTSIFILTKELLPLLKKSKRAMVLNVGSEMGVMPVGGRIAYCSSKFGLRGLTLSLAKEFKGRNIDFVLLTLGSVMTDFGTGGIAKRRVLEKKGKKYLQPQEVVEKVIEITRAEQRQPEYILYPPGYGEK